MPALYQKINNQPKPIGGVIGSVIRILFEDEYVGDTITFEMDNIATQTQVVPASRTVTFVTEELGTATITDTTTENSMKLEIETYSLYEQEFSTFNYKAWLNSAGITTQFSSLEEVLASEITLRTLMTKHASVDYMIAWCEANETIAEKILDTDLVAKWVNLRDYCLDKVLDSTVLADLVADLGKYGYGEWALIDGTWQPKGAVPIMISDSAPYGVISGSNPFSTDYSRYKAFDNNPSTAFISSSTSGYIQYEFVNPIKIRKMYCKPHYYSAQQVSYIKGWELKVSNDGNSWTTIASGVHENLNDAFEMNIENQEVEYVKYVKLEILSTYKTEPNQIGVDELQFYGRQLSVSVPKMTSDTAPWGECFGSSLDTTEPKRYYGLVFNKDESTDSHNKYNGTENIYAGYKFLTPVRCKLCYIMNEANTPHNFLTGKVQASNDGIQWDDVSEVINGINTAGQRFFIPCNPTNDYLYYRFLALTIFSGNTFWTIQQLNFFCLDYSEHEERHWIYDHGVELEQTEALLMQTGCAEVEKRSDCLYMKGKVNDQNGNISTSNAIDLTTYNLMRVISGNEFVNIDQSTGRNQLVVRSSKTALGNVLAYTYVPNTDLPNGLFISVASINQNSYVMLFENKNGAIFTAKEWWLE